MQNVPSLVAHTHFTPSLCRLDPISLPSLHTVVDKVARRRNSSPATGTLPLLVCRLPNRSMIPTRPARPGGGASGELDLVPRCSTKTPMRFATRSMPFFRVWGWSVTTRAGVEMSNCSHRGGWRLRRAAQSHTSRLWY